MVSQDRNSGAEAAEWGRATARKIADALGARSTSHTSNEATYNAKRVVIKTAHQKTTSVGGTYEMLKRLVDVIAAWEVARGMNSVYGAFLPKCSPSTHATAAAG